MIIDLIKKKRLFEIKQPLDEISYEYAEEVENWLADNGDQVALPFNDLFDGELRKVIPLGKAIAPNSEIASFLNWFKRNGYELDFKTGLASKEVEDRQGNKRLKQMKPGKLLAQAQKYLTKMDKLYGEMNDIVVDLGYSVDYRENEPWQKKREERMSTLERAENVFPAISRDVTQTVQNHIQFWNKKSQFYRENPEKAFIEYSIILSRAPIDVLRMSDHKNIRSCHSEGSDYFKCARAEAQGHGPIAYAVETRDLEDIDLDDDEVFEDWDRGVSGIEPVARVRLRRFVEKESGTDFAVPEQRTYGTSIPGFVNKVTDWARESQKSVWENFIDENSGKIKQEFHNMFYRTGGSYTDTSSSSLFNKMFEDYGANFHGSAPHRGSEEEFEDGVDEYEQDYERFHEELRELSDAIENADYNVSRLRDVGPTGESGFYFSGEIQNDEYMDIGDEPDAYFSGGMEFKFIEGEESLPSDWREQQQIADEIQSLIDGEVYLGIMETQIDDVGNTIEVRVEFEARIGGDRVTAYDINEFVEDMERTSEEYNDIKAMIYAYLAKSGYVNPSAATTLTNKLAAGELEFKHFDLTHDNEGHYISLKVDDEDEATGVDFPKRVDTYRAPKTSVGPIRNRLLELMREAYGGARGLSATSNNRYGLVQSKQFTRQVIDLLTPEIAAIVKANADQQKLDLQENSSITPQAIEAHLLQGFVLKLREIQQKQPHTGHGRRKEEVPGKTPIYVDVEEMHYSLDDEDEFEIVEPIIAFFVHLDKNIDKLFKAITDVLQTLDVQYGNKTVEGQSQINDIVQMADDVAEFVKGKTGGVTYDDSAAFRSSISSPRTYREKLLQALKRANYVLAKLTSPGDQSYISMFTGIETQYPLRMNDSERFKKIITMLQRDHAEMNTYWKDLTPEDLEKPLEQEEEPHKPADDRDDGWQPGMPVTESLVNKLRRYLDEQTKVDPKLVRNKIGNKTSGAFRYGPTFVSGAPAGETAMQMTRGNEYRRKLIAQKYDVAPEHVQIEPARGDKKITYRVSGQKGYFSNPEKYRRQTTKGYMPVKSSGEYEFTPEQWKEYTGIRPHMKKMHDWHTKTKLSPQQIAKVAGLKGKNIQTKSRFVQTSGAGGTKPVKDGTLPIKEESLSEMLTRYLDENK